MNNDSMFSEGSILPEEYVSPAPSSGKRKSGRRSWFTPNKQIRLEIAVDPREQKQTRHVEEEEIEILTLTHFTKPPKIDFGTVRVGKTYVRKLCANNPHDYTQQVVVEKFPFDKDFTIDLTEFFVEAGDSQMIELTWSPKEECSHRQMILFKVEGVVRLQAFLIGKAEVPAKPKKRKTWKAPKAAPLVTLQPSASMRSKQLQSSKKIEDTNRAKSSFARKPVQSRDSRKSSKQPIKKSVMADKENTPPRPRYSRETRYDCSEEENDVIDDMNVSNLQRSLTYSKLNQSFSPSPKRPLGSQPNSRRGSEDTKRASKESMFSVYEDCMQSRRPSHESVISVYEDCRAVDSRRPSQDGPMTLDDLESSTARKSTENKRLSKESVVSVYEDASEYLESPGSDEYDDSLMMPADESKGQVQPDTPSKSQSGFSRDILVESYEVVEQVEEEIITEEIKITQTKIMSDSYEISNDVNVEMTRDSTVRHHEHIIKETFVHVDGSPQRYFPGITSSEKRFFPPIDKQEFVSEYVEDDAMDIRRETVVITTAARSVPHIHVQEETDLRRETVVLSKLQGKVSNSAKPSLYTQSPTKLLPPDHIAGDTSFSPLQSNFSPKSPQCDPNADPNESRRDTVTMECPSPALVACHSRLVKAGQVGCVDRVDSSTPLKIVDLCGSPKSSTPIPGRKIGMRRNVFGPKWVQEHMEEPPCSPVTRLAEDTSPTSPRKSLFSAEPEPRRFSTHTVVKTKPAMSELSPEGTRNEQSPVINASTVTKSRSSVGQYMTSDPTSKQFERTIDQSVLSNYGDASDSCLNSRRLSSLTVTKSIPSNSVHDTIPECAEAVIGDLDPLQIDDQSPSTQNNASFSTSINSRTRSGSKKKRRSSGKHGRRSSQARVIRSETVTKSRSSLTPPVVGGQPRKRLSSKKLFSPPQSVPVMDESIKPLSPSPKKRLSASGEARLVARMRQDHESSLEFPVHHSRVTANLTQNKDRKSVDTSNIMKPPAQNTFRRSVDPACLAREAFKPPKRRSFGNKTLSTNVNRPATKPPTKPTTVDGASSLKLTRTQMLRRNAAKSAMKADPKASSMHSIGATDASNKLRSRYQSGPVLNKSAANRSRIASGASGLAKSKLTLIRSKPNSGAALPKHPMPFAAKNVYYDERWMEKQERGFVKWLNFVLTPPDEYVEAMKPQKVKDTISKLIVDAGKLCLDAQSNPKLAPTKEVISFRTYAASRRLNRLRRHACKMFQTEENAKIIKKLEIEIDTRHLAVRQDRKIHADLGIKQKLLDMMLSYNPLWLRIGLEVIFGEVLPIESNVDIIGMSRFIVTRLLGNPDIAQAFAHPTVPHLYAAGYDEAIAQHILKKFLLLVHFLDQAKTARLIDHDPCLFCKDAEFKSSRDLLLVFARDYLRGEGDLTRHLSYMGYTVKYTQTALEEFDYAVACLASDLRDGVRLTRVIEMLSKAYCLTSRMRVPAISRLQKIHNMEVALKALRERGLDLSATKGGSICARDVVDGHREKTLLLLWNIIFNFQVECLINKDQLKEEVDFLRENLQLQKQYQALLDDLDKSTSMLGLPRDRRESIEPDVYFKSPMLSLLLKWCQAVCSYYGMKVENFTVSFSDGRALCYLVHHYHPSLLKVEDVSTDTTLTYNEKHNRYPDTPGSGSDDSFSYNWTTTFSPSMGKPGVFEQLLANEKSNFKLLFDKVSELGGIPVMVRYADMSNTIPDEKVVITYITYLCARLLDIRHETRAARIIQAAWRNFRNRKTTLVVKEHKEEVEKQKRVKAITKIQAWWRYRGHRQNFQAKRRACITIQQHWRARKLSREQQLEYQRLKTSSTILQRHFRKLLLKRRIRRQKAAVTIINCWRVYKARRQMKKTMNGIVKLQAFVRRYQARRAYLCKKSAAIKIQRFCRSYQLRKLDQETLESRRKAVTVIQKYLRCYNQRRKYVKARNAAIRIQSNWRAYSAQVQFTKMRYAATLIQEQYRAHLLSLQVRAQYVSTKAATLVIQTYVRQWLEKKSIKQMRAACKIQAIYRGYIERRSYLELRNATVKLQAQVRMILERRRYLQLCSATVLLQSHVRAYQAMKSQREVFLCQRNAAICIQAHYRGYRSRLFVRQLKAVIALQATVRMYLVRKQYLREVGAVVMVQKNVRMYLARKDFSRKRSAATLIQNHFRFHLLRREIETDFQKMKKAAQWIQCWYRKVTARKNYLKCKQSALTIQTWWRMLSQRRSYLKQRNSAVVIQRYYRKHQEERKQQLQQERRTAASCVIQSYWRQHVAQKQYEKQKSSAILIQSYVRRHRAKRHCKERLQAVLVLQKYVRAWWLGKCQWELYHIQRGACLVIQTRYRAWLAERAYSKVKNAAMLLQAYMRMVLQRRKYQELRSAAVVIQRKWKATLQARRQQREYILQRVAAIILQAIYRGQRCRKSLKKQRTAATTIQSYVRSHQQRQQYQNTRSAVVTIQKWYRNWKVMQCTKEQFRERRKAVICIQSHVKGFIQRRKYIHHRRCVIKVQSVVRMHHAQKSFICKKQAAITLQRRWRSNLLSRQVKRDFVAQKQAAVTIQSYSRALLTRRRFLVMKQGFTRLQALVRMASAKGNYNMKIAAVRTLQTYTKAHLTGKQVRQEFLAQKQAAITIQSHYRTLVTRRRFLVMKQGFIRLQAIVRMVNSKKSYKRKIAAVRTLQMYTKAHLIGKRVRQEFLAQKQAAITIQSYSRALLTRRKFLVMKQGFIHLQALFRMAHEKRSYNKKLIAVHTLQMYTRAYLIGNHLRQEYLVKKQAAITIQSHYRTLVTRKRFLVMKQGFIRLQALVRMASAKKAYDRKIIAVRTLQTYARAYLLGQQVRREFVSKKKTHTEAAVLIQRVYRSYTQRKTYKHTLQKVVKVQSTVRRWLAKRMLQKLIVRRNAVLCIQTHYRAYRLGVEERQRYMIHKAAALILQTHFRRYSCRQKFLTTRKAAVTLQSAYRMHKARTEFKGTLIAVGTIQKWYRQCRISKTQRQTFLRTRSAVICIQSAFRGYKCRQYVKQMNASATKIQACFRRHTIRTRYVKQISAVKTIQVWYRAITTGRQQQQNFVQMKQSTVIAQSCVRRFLAKRRYERLRHTVIRLQSVIRMLQARKRTSRKLTAIVTIQRRWRAARDAHVTRSDFLAQKKACITLQSTFRMYITRQRYQRMRMGFIRLQALARMCQQRRKYQQQKQAVRIIQSNVRTYCMVQRLKKACQTKKAAVMLIQTHWRAYKARQKIKQIKAAICIQAVYRCYAEKRLYQAKIRLITKLQARVRGCQARRQFKLLQTQNRAAICIQRCIRKYITHLQTKKQMEIRKVQLEKITTVVRRHLHVVRIQRCVRRYQSVKRAEAQMSSIITIQRWMRSKLERRRFLRIKQSVITLQRVFRVWRSRKFVENQKKCATKIQAVWRSYCVRKANKSKKLTAVRQRVQEANAAATEDKKLCNRTSSALDFLLNYKQLAYILEALINLEAVTRLSPECCEQMVEGHALPVIYTLIKSCNRSIPHMELIKYSVAVLLNVAKYEKTAGAVFKVENSIDTLVEVMTHFREKGQVFTKSCTLVGILCYDAQRKKEVRSMTKIVDKIQSIHKIVSRKHNMEEKRQLIKSKMAASQSFCGALPGIQKTKPHFIRPQWVLRRNSIHVIEDPMKAISFVMNCLNLTSK